MNNEDYKLALLQQLDNSKTSGIAEYFSWMYFQIEKEIPTNGTVLEIGAGAGVSRLFLRNTKVLRTDLLDHNLQGIQSGVDAENLPFESNHFNAAFAVDMIHHVPFPHKVVSELIRVTNSTGKIVIVEPFVSLFSLFVYKFFHSEKTSMFLKYSMLKPMVGPNAADGDQVICQRLFSSKVGKNYLQENFGSKIKVTRHLISPLSFFLTGGVNRPFRTSAKAVRLAIRIESQIPNLLLQLIAARQIIVIEKYVSS